MSTISYPLPLPVNNFSTQIASTSVATNTLSVQLDSVAGLPTEGVGQFFKKDANGDVVSGSIEFVHWTGVAGSSITFSDVGDRGITGSDSGAQSYVADDYFECWVSSYYAPDPDRTPGLTNTQTWTGENTFEDIKIDDNGLDIAQIATPASPSAGRNKLYFKSDGKAYTLNSSGTEAGVGGGAQTEVFIIAGTFPSSATTNLSKTWFAPAALTISSIDLYVATAGSGANTTYVDVNKSGTTLFTTQGNRPALTTTGTSSTGKVPDVTSVAAGDPITIDVDAITAVAPSDGYVLIHYTRN